MQPLLLLTSLLAVLGAALPSTSTTNILPAAPILPNIDLATPQAEKDPVITFAMADYKGPAWRLAFTLQDLENMWDENTAICTGGWKESRGFDSIKMFEYKHIGNWGCRLFREENCVGENLWIERGEYPDLTTVINGKKWTRYNRSVKCHRY